MILQYIRSVTLFQVVAVLLFFGVMYITTKDVFVEETIEVAEEPQINRPVDPKQLACMATNIYYEARNEPTKGQAAVARVVMNRIHNGIAGTPCAVIYQTTKIEKINEYDERYYDKVCQFSWVCENKPAPNKNDPKYKHAESIAYDVLAHDAYNDLFPTSVMFFHNLSVNPLWPHKVVAQIGNHIFYSKYKKTSKHHQNV
jgi:spore germination cell wall hydrolase CwlJ-like protein